MCQNLEIILVFLFPENLILPVKELIVIIMLNCKRRRKFCLIYGLLLRSITLGDGSQGEGGTLTFEECVFYGLNPALVYMNRYFIFQTFFLI